MMSIGNTKKWYKGTNFPWFLKFCPFTEFLHRLNTNYCKSHAVTKHLLGLIVKTRSSRKLRNDPRISQWSLYIAHKHLDHLLCSPEPKPPFCKERLQMA